ncbi:Hypothetical protein PHPALM_18002 [Phytophthora palmivora]|uniref:Tyr recombinase domain-containing protein n=1 Tax=Phytophthora palmivora TaxID=4796 RepID=A0A2P4XKW8_9STRA|nr:Hypothetical protein PHPALM_18002 [Phytophthora palmivora]
MSYVGQYDAKVKLHVLVGEVGINWTRKSTDLGSRAWDEPRLTNWRSLTNGWTQISIPNAIRKIYSARWSAFSSAPSLNHLDVSTREPGSIGQSFVSASECQGGSRNTTWTRNPYCWLSSPFIAGPEEINTVESLQVPFSLKSAISTGIIGHLPDLNLDSVQIMPSLSPECVEQVQQQGDEVPSREQCCSGLSVIRYLDFQQFQHRVIAGAARLGFSFLLRSAEYLVGKGRRRVYTLQVRDVSFRDELGFKTSNPMRAISVQISLRGQKNDQQGQGEKRVLSRSSHQILCPVFAARLLMDNARSLQLQPEEPICSIKASTMLSAEIISKVLQAAAKATGEDVTLFSCHSLRRGGATALLSALLSAGVDSTAVMLHGRWKSDSYQRYTSYTNESGRFLATRMAFGGSYTSQQPLHRQ